MKLHFSLNYLKTSMKWNCHCSECRGIYYSKFYKHQGIVIPIRHNVTHSEFDSNLMTISKEQECLVSFAFTR